MTEATTRAFLERLWKLQGERGIRDAELARMLGISHSYVYRLKQREHIRHLGHRIALAAAREFPELAVFLTADLPIIQGDQTVRKPAEAEEQR